MSDSAAERAREQNAEQSHPKLIRLFVNGALAASLFVLIFYAWYFHRASTTSPDIWMWLAAFVTTLACLVGLLFFISFPKKPEVSLVLVSVAIAIFSGDQLLKRYGRGLKTLIEARFSMLPGVSQNQRKIASDVVFISPKAPATRDRNEIVTFYENAGIKLEREFNSFALLPLLHFEKNKPFLPLGGLSNSLIPLCNEGDQRLFPIVRNDRYGFNNDDTAYAWGQGQTLIVGDSFAHGSCVHQDENVAGMLRKNGYPTISVGVGGFGPILTLASIREYGPILKPSRVLWFYFDGNDIDDLTAKELRSKFLLQYLKPDFKQNLALRQKEIDAYWRKASFSNIQKEFSESKVLAAQWLAQLDTNLPIVRGLLKKDLKSLHDDDSLIEIFRSVLQLAEAEVATWGGKIIFVAIPNMDDYHGRIPRYRERVLQVARQMRLEIVDVDFLLRASGDPLQYFPRRDDWGHLNPRGYALMAHEIARKISGVSNLSSPPRVEEKKASQTLPLPSFPVVTRQSYRTTSIAQNALVENAKEGQPGDGSAIMGYSFMPRNRFATIRVQIAVNAVLGNDNTLVAALFRSGIESAIREVSVSGVAGQTVQAAGIVDIPLKGDDALSLQLRVGPRRPGAIRLNPEKSDPSVFPTMTVWELGAIGRGFLPGAYDFHTDDGSKSYAQRAGGYGSTKGEAGEVAGRGEVPCERYFGRSDTLVILAIGESQAGNHAESKIRTDKDIVNFDPSTGRCFRAADPLLGATGSGGALWIGMAERLIVNRAFASVVLVPGAFEGTFITDWTPPGEMSRRLAFLVHRLKRAGGKIDVVLWQQGETEAARPWISETHYYDSLVQLREFIRELGVGAPIYTALSTYCQKGASSMMSRNVGSNVRGATIRFDHDFADIHLGADTDTISHDLRFDGCNFGAQGQAEAAKLWARALRDVRKNGTSSLGVR